MTSSGITRINRKINCAGHRTDLKSDRSARVTVRFCSLPPNNRDVVKLVISSPFKVTLRVRVPSGIPNCYVYELRFVIRIV